ncbi:MAG: hypothetical protein KGP28_03300 [Bdellovibrionales bacterium]|nr:hypothetical protein [Bdellovibrionales bacterium]
MWPKNRKSSIQQWMKQIENQGFKFFCVSCRRERRQSPPAKVGSVAFFFHVFLATMSFTLLFWPLMGAKGFLAFLIPAGAVLEAVYRLKMRSAMVCPDCKFDPILYLVDRQKAIGQVEDAWRKKFSQKGIPFPEKTRASGEPRRSLDFPNTTGVSQRHVNQ